MRGYTVIELLVALLIFSIVITSAVGIMVSSVQSSRKSTAVQDMEDNLRAIFESMIKELRTGSDFNIQQNGERISFTFAGTSATPSGNITYRLMGNNIEREGRALNDNDISVEKLLFIGNKPGGGNGIIPDTVQPQITIFMEVKSANQPDIKSMNLQTTVSARSY